VADQQHQSDPAILDRRTLASNHRRLAALLAPGLHVLDVGCGTGAIAKGIAEAVGAGGTVVGVDRDGGLIERARARYAALPNLRFEQGDATQLSFDGRFDIVTAARTLQWIADVPAAIRPMARAAKPGGRLVLLDYDHSRNRWDPAPPAEFAAFYAAFLSWRAANGWDNDMASHLPALLRDAGLDDVRSHDEDEVSVRGEAGFGEETALWGEVIDNLGPALVAARVCDEALLAAARRAYEAWRRTDLVRQTLAMKAVVATRRAAGTRLAIYGSLAPGRENHHQLAGLIGQWRPGTVRGTRLEAGWGATLGYPALTLEASGPIVDVLVFESPDLPAHWARLDAFEGEGYRRVVTTVTTPDGAVEAYIYVAAATS
jgi:SAM-dependent methyltransferase